VADVAHIDDKLAKRIADLIRQLTSDRPNVIDMAVQALGRTLQKAGPDAIHIVAERIEHPNEISEADMQALIDEGIGIGEKRAEQKRRARNAPPELPDARTMTLFCYQRLDQLDDWYQQFIPNILVKRVQRGIPLSPPQQSKLEEAYIRLGGGI
jgi:hypothetical protein